MYMLIFNRIWVLVNVLSHKRCLDLDGGWSQNDIVRNFFLNYKCRRVPLILGLILV